MKDRWVIYDRGNDTFLRYLDNGQTVFFDSEKAANNDCYGNEEVLLYEDNYFFHKRSLFEETINK